MSLETLEETFRWVFGSGLVQGPFSLLWHAGEPLSMPLSFYESATQLLERMNTPRVAVKQWVQTNATLVNDQWCAFFQQHNVNVGVSIDGPAFLHDRYRRTRSGTGTFDRVMQGIEHLHHHKIPFVVLSVLTDYALDYPDELFDFYCQLNPLEVGFNAEDIEGPNTRSTLNHPLIRERYRRFIHRFFQLAYSADPPLQVREWESATSTIFGTRFRVESRRQESWPFAIVNVDCDGNFGTYSPELLGYSDAQLGAFSFGHVSRDSLNSVLASERFRRLDAEIAEGVRKCAESCSYFGFCGGGPPANKFFENGSFATTQTLSCRLQLQVCVDETLSLLAQQREQETRR
jgi:uncharacterized protein